MTDHANPPFKPLSGFEVAQHRKWYSAPDTAGMQLRAAQVVVELCDSHEALRQEAASLRQRLEEAEKQEVKVFDSLVQAERQLEQAQKERGDNYWQIKLNATERRASQAEAERDKYISHNKELAALVCIMAKTESQLHCDKAQAEAALEEMRKKCASLERLWDEYQGRAVRAEMELKIRREK